jgi:hypothetical protein
MEAKTRFTVDAVHCQRAADELYEMLWRQEREFLERYNSLGLVKRVPRVLSVLGLLLSIVALLLCVASLAFDSSMWWRRPETWAIPLFIALAVMFIFSARLRDRLQSWAFRVAQRRARRRADKLVKVARNLAPYEADFDVKGDLLVYSRGKEGDWQLAWSRKLSKFRTRGVAVQASNVTAIFRKPRSFVPSIVILQTDPAWVREALQSAGLAFKPIDAE